MNNKQYQLLMENWRSYVAQSELDEGIKDQLFSIAKNKLQEYLKSFTEFLQKNAAKITPAEFSQIAAISPQFKSIGEDMAEIKKNFEADSQQINALKENKSFENFNKNIINKKEIQEFLLEIEKKEKELDEFGIAAIAGAGLGGIGLGILIMKGLLFVVNKLGFEGKGIKFCLTKLEQVEQKIKNFVSSLKVLDAAGYQLLKLLLGFAQKNQDGFFARYFKNSGITIYIQPGKRLPDMAVILNPDLRATNKDIAHHVEHEADFNFFLRNPNAYKQKYGEKKFNKQKEQLKLKDPKKYKKLFEPQTNSAQQDYYQNNAQNALSRMAEADSHNSGPQYWQNKQLRKMAQQGGGGEKAITQQEANELKKLVAINQKLAYMCVLGGFMAYGIYTMLHHGIHGVAGAVEATATGTKATEQGLTAGGVIAKGTAAAAAAAGGH